RQGARAGRGPLHRQRGRPQGACGTGAPPPRDPELRGRGRGHRRRHARRPDRRQRRVDHHPGARAVRAMTPDAALDRLVRRVAAQVRWRRIEHYALRGFFWASLPAVALLVLKGIVGPQALPAAAVLLVAGALLGALWGAFKRTTRADAARLADRAFGLEDRVATALEWAVRPDRTPLVD